MLQGPILSNVRPVGITNGFMETLPIQKNVRNISDIVLSGQIDRIYAVFNERDDQLRRLNSLRRLSAPNA